MGCEEQITHIWDFFRVSINGGTHLSSFIAIRENPILFYGWNQWGYPFLTQETSRNILLGTSQELHFQVQCPDLARRQLVNEWTDSWENGQLIVLQLVN
jgi:hypothetical protein